MAESSKFTHIAVEKPTKHKIAILATIHDERIYEMVADWVDREWKSAKEAGLVRDSMLEILEPEAA